MLKDDLEKLVLSLSASEKKSFKLHCNTYRGRKDYLDLFNLLSESPERAQELFRKKHPSKSYENTAAYLLKILLEMLVQIRTDQDKWFSKYHGLMKARLCFERALPGKGIKELKKVQSLARETQDHLIEHLASRMELSQLADSGFPELTEQDLINRQMKSRNTLQTLRRIQEHYSLYELLSYRLLHPETPTKGNKDKKFTDLVLSELSITTQGSHHQYESKKLHLLFQSYFLIHTGEYRSAIKVFRELNELIEKHEHMWNFPPYDYLSSLEGILDALRSIRHIREMEYFLGKLEHLSSKQYPEHFVNRLRQIQHLYRLTILIESGNLAEATALFESIKRGTRELERITDGEKYPELLFLGGLAFFQKGDRQKANRYIGQAIDAGKNCSNPLIYRSCRLLYVIIHYEMDNIDYLQYEIRAYKRAFHKRGRSFLVEKLIFTIITLDPKRCSGPKKKIVWKKVKPQMAVILNDRYELQLLKYFDFCKWIRNKVGSETYQNEQWSV